MIWPKPWQVMHGRVVITWPRKLRCTCWISPRPAHTSQVRVEVPGCIPAPRQVEQATAVSMVRSFCAPNTASPRSMSSRTRASWPRVVRERGPRPAVPAWPPKKASMMSLNEKPWPKPAAPEP